MLRALRFVPVWLIAAACCALPAVAAAGAEPSGGPIDGVSALPAPTLTVQPRGTLSSVWVEAELPDGSRVRRRLRETAASARAGTTGRDPSGRAAFVTWTEGSRTWSAWSRDAGATWHGVRPRRASLRLHDGATPPNAPLPAVPLDYVMPPEGELFLVQFRTVGLPEWRQALRDAGARVLNHFPHNAHIVRMPAAIVRQVRTLDFVLRVEPYEPWFRLDRELRDWVTGTGAHAAAEELRVRVMVFGDGDAAKRPVVDFAESVGARVAQYWPSGHVLELWSGRPALRRLAAHNDVMWIDRWSPRETDMNLVRQDAGNNWVESAFGYCGQGVRGEVMDNGVETTHQDFDGIMTHGATNVESHGTHSYGVVFGNGDRDGDGSSPATGHLPCAEQGIFADYDSMVDRFAHTQDLKQSPYFAAFQTNSWGNDRTTAYNSFSSEMDDIIWQLDIAITQSQSNAGATATPQNARPQAWAKNIISVGGIKHKNTAGTSDDEWCDGSDCASIGPAADGRIKPDLVYWYDFVFSTETGNSYSDFGGTSAAAPEVAGVVGLIAQLWAENEWNTNPSGTTVFDKLPHFSTLKALAINNAQQYAFSGTAHDLTRMHQGWGRPSARVAQERAATSFIVDNDQALEVGESAVYYIDVSAGETDLKVTMVYADPPGTTSATLHRINDVDLKVVSPSGTTYHGNVGLDASTQSTAGGSPNTVDTVENVFVVNPEAGTWTVTISAPEVNSDAHTATPAADVTFALVVTGGVAGSAPQTPGEAGRPSSGPLLVTGYNDATGVLSLSYGTACVASDAVIEYGELTYANVSTYNWSGQQCGLGNTGTYDWNTSALPASLFFVVVGQTIDAEGSYGVDDGGNERPEDTGGAGCPRSQDLSNPCM